MRGRELGGDVNGNRRGGRGGCGERRAGGERRTVRTQHERREVARGFGWGNGFEKHGGGRGKGGGFIRGRRVEVVLGEAGGEGGGRVRGGKRGFGGVDFGFERVEGCGSPPVGPLGLGGWSGEGEGRGSGRGTRL